MNQANNNEMDTMLRQYGRSARGAQVESQFADGKRLIGDHLDADELNAFAEGGVPERARARFTEHLADCGNCRSIVVSLSQASGAPVLNPVLDKQAAPGFWSKLSAFFSPQVLRYAMPAVALAAVITLTLIALRRDRNTEFVAQHQPSAPAAVNQSGDVAVTSDSLTEDQKTKTVTTTDLPAQDKDAGANTLLKDSAPTRTLGGAGSAAKDATVAAAEPQPSFAPEAPVAAAPPPAAKRADTEEFAFKKDEADNEYLARQQRNESGPARGSRGQMNQARNSPATGTTSNRQVEGLMAERRAYGNRNKQRGEDDEETRTVSGHEFRREGNTWVDTGYSSSMSTTSVARGSEYYRSLVADEPGLGSIASQFSGDVLIVWKGKAYRFY